jgi:hypothetical protein
MQSLSDCHAKGAHAKARRREEEKGSNTNRKRRRSAFLLRVFAPSRERFLLFYDYSIGIDDDGLDYPTLSFCRGKVKDELIALKLPLSLGLG